MATEHALIAERYVRALFALATEQNVHDAVKRDVLAIQSLLSQSAELQKLLVNPIISRKQAESAVDAVLAALGTHALTRRFFALLARSRRLELAPAAIDAYLHMLAESRGEAQAQVTSARKLSDAQKAELIQALSRATGKTVELNTRENPALLGGIQVRIGSRLLDASVAGKLDRLRSALKTAA